MPALREDMAEDAQRAAALLALCWVEHLGLCDEALLAAVDESESLGAAARGSLGFVPPHRPPVKPELDVDGLMKQFPRLKKVGDIRTWLWRAGAVPEELSGALLAPLLSLLTHSSREVCEGAHGVLGRAVEHASRGPIVQALLAAGLAEDLVLRASELGDETALRDVDARAAHGDASASMRLRARWNHADAVGMQAVLAGASNDDARLLMALCRGLAFEGTKAQVAATQATLRGLLSHADPDVAFSALDTLAELALKGIASGALDAAAAALGETAKRQTLRHSHTHGHSAAMLLGAEIVCGSEGAEARVVAACSAKKAAIRDDACFALGFGLSRTGRWDDLKAHLRRSERDANALTLGVTFASYDGQDAARRDRWVSVLDEAQLEPLRLESFRLGILPAPRSLRGSRVVELLLILGTRDRWYAESAFIKAAEVGAHLGDAIAPLVGVLLCGDFASPYPYALRALALAARNGEDVTLIGPFLTQWLGDKRADIRGAAMELAVHCGMPIEVEDALRLVHAPHNAKVCDHIVRNAARHAAEALARTVTA
jgi:hypothetical protein